jgi:hypothetical protein
MLAIILNLLDIHIMSYENAKMVLSGGVASTPFLHEIFEAAGTDTPQIAFDGSPCVTQESLDKKRKLWKGVCERFLLPEPLWLQDYVDEPLSRGKTNALIDKADVLYVTGGASRKGITQWHEAGVTDDIKEHVSSGALTVAGGSAGGMIWFDTGLSDSESYDVADGDNWDYIPVKEASFFESWVMAHYTDTDNLGREKKTEFANFLRQHDGEWKYAVGIDTCAAIVCIGGIAHVRDITPPSMADKGYGNNVHLYFDSIREPRKLSDGDLIPMDRL